MTTLRVVHNCFLILKDLNLSLDMMFERDSIPVTHTEGKRGLKNPERE